MIPLVLRPLCGPVSASMDVGDLHCHLPPRTRTSLQRPHRASLCPGLGWPSPATLKPQPEQSGLQRQLQQVPADHPLLLTTARLPRSLGRLRRRRGRRSHPVEGGDLLLAQLLAGLGPAQQRVPIRHLPPFSASPGLATKAMGSSGASSRNRVHPSVSSNAASADKERSPSHCWSTGVGIH